MAEEAGLLHENCKKFRISMNARISYLAMKYASSKKFERVLRCENFAQRLEKNHQRYAISYSSPQ